MMTRRRALWALALAGALLASAPAPALQARAPGALPARLSDKEFWQLIDDFSEANGYFQSDNLVSNEDTFQYVIPDLLRIVPAGGVYLGVGPDQNFTYIAATRPRMAFITDIRRGNLQAQLMYKALFELSSDRAEFISRLFSRKRPSGLGSRSTATELFQAFDAEDGNPGLYAENLRTILSVLARQRGGPLDPDDARGIEYVYDRFYQSGPGIAYAMGSFGRAPMRYPTFEQLQIATDGKGASRAYLGSEEAFVFVKTMEHDNRLVPLVGDFAGAKALRSVGRYIAERSATVSVFYTSNVEQYLFQNGVWPAFARNVATMPLDETSTFIRSCFNTCGAPYGSRSVTLLDSIPGLLRDFADGRIQNYWQVLQHSK